MMKILVCGGRNFNDKSRVFHTLDSMVLTWALPDLIIEGGAPGADTLAREWAKSKGIHFATIPALWDFYKKAAGPKRNSVMGLLRPDMCVAFPGNSGTADMVEKCLAANIPVWKPYG